jgi:hypothetical protein
MGFCAVEAAGLLLVTLWLVNYVTCYRMLILEEAMLFLVLLAFLTKVEGTRLSLTRIFRSRQY